MSSLIRWKKEVNGPGMKTAEVLWQHNSIPIGAEVKMPQRPLESKNTNSLRACLKCLTKGGERRDTLLPPPAPPLHQSIFTHTKMGDAWILPTSLKHGTIPLSAPSFLGKAYGS